MGEITLIMDRLLTLHTMVHDNHNYCVVRGPIGSTKKMQARKWCNEFTGNGSFYYHDISNYIWFTCKEDALWFKLKWDNTGT